MAVETSRRVTLGFIDNQGENFKVSIPRVKDLTDDDGKGLVNDAMDAMITNQPYVRTLAAKTEAYETDTIKTDIEMS